MISLTFPYFILRSLRYPPVVLGLVYTAATIATAVLGLGFGYLADSWSKKQTLVIAGLLLPASCLLVCFSSKLPIILAAAMLGGYSASGSLAGGGVGGAAQPIQSAALAELTNTETRTAYFSVFTFVSGLFAAFGALLSRLFTVREVFLAAALIGLAGVAFLIPVRLKPASGTMRKLPSRRVIGRFTITGALNGFAQGLVTPFLIPFFILVYEVPKWRMSIYGFVSGALGAFAILAAPALERRWGFVKSIAITRGLGAILLALMPLSPYFALALAIYFVTPAMRVAALPVQQSAVTELVSEAEVGRALGINQVARLAASSGATAFAGYLFHVKNVGLPFYLYGGLMMLNVYLYFRLFRSDESRESRT